MELEKVIQDTVNNMVSSGKVTEMVEKHLSATVDEIVKDALRSYGDFGKQVKEAINHCINVDLENIKLIDLGGVINDTIKDQLSTSVNENILKGVTETINELTGKLDKEEYKLSEIIELFKSGAESWDKEDSSEITCIVEHSDYGYKHVYFDYEEDKKKYSCDFHIDLDKENKVYAFQGGKMAASSDPRFKSIHGTFEKFLYRLYASKTKVIIDDVDKYYEEDYD